MMPPTVSFPDLPADAFRHILSFLRAPDIERLHLALPSTSLLRVHTLDPLLWCALYARDFLRFPPAPPLSLRVTSAGTLDWRAAYAEASRRRDCVRRQRQIGWGFPHARRSSHGTGTAAARTRFAWSERLGGSGRSTGEVAGARDGEGEAR